MELFYWHQSLGYLLSWVWDLRIDIGDIKKVVKIFKHALMKAN